MARNELSKLAKDLKPYIVPWIQAAGLSGGGGGGASGSGGVSDHGLLTGLGDNDHPQYLLRTGGVMSGDLNMGGHDIANVGLVDGFDISGFSGNLTSLQTAVAALQARTVLAGDGIDSDGVLFGAGSPTVAVDVSDFAGAGLADDGSNNLEVNEAYDFAWTGDQTLAGSIESRSPTFDAADPITGFRIQADGNAWFANLEATYLTIKTFVSDVTLALQGSQIIAKSKGIVSRDFTTPTTTGTLYVYDLPGQPDTAVFESGDSIRLRYVYRDTGLQVGDVWGTVSSYADLGDGEQSWTFTRTAGDVGQTIYAGMVAIDYGQSGDGYIELSSLGSDTPEIAIRTWTSNPALSANHTTKSLLGNLAGQSSAVYGALSGFGIWTDTGYIEGRVGAANGTVFLDDNAVTIKARPTAITNIAQANSLTFSTDPEDPDSSNTAASVQGALYESVGNVYASLAAIAAYGSANGADGGIATFGLDDTDSSTENGSIQFSAVGGAVTGFLVVQNEDGTPGALTVVGTSQVKGDWKPISDSAYDLGSPSAYWANAYIDNLYVNTTVGVPDEAHHHNDLYNTKAEITTLLSGKSDTSHTHAGLVTSISLAITLADYVTSTALSTTLGGYATDAELTSGLAGKSNTGHSHNLGDLAERNYSSLTSRGHVLADADGLGDDHTVSGLTTGHVLRATGATAAKFMQLLYTDLGSRGHSIVGGDHTVSAAQYSVVSTWGAANTLSMVTAVADGSAGHKLLKTDGSGDLILNDLTANDISAADLTLSGAISSSNYVADSAGYYISGDRSEFGSLYARGAFRAATFEAESTAVFAGRQLIVKSSGVLRANLAIDTGVTTEYDIDIEDPAAGHFIVFAVGDRLAVRGFAEFITPTSSGNSIIPQWQFWRPYVLPNGLRPGVAWFTVTSIADNGTHYTYTCEWQAGDDDLTFLRGEGVASYGQSGDGGIESIATGTFAPRLRMFTHSGSPWSDTVDHVAMGNIGDLTHLGATSTSWGAALGDDLSDADASYILAATGAGVVINNGDLTLRDAGGKVLEISRDNGMLVYANQVFDDLIGDHLGARLATNNAITFADKNGLALGRVGYTATQAEAFGDYVFDYQGSYVVLEALWYAPAAPETPVTVGDADDEGNTQTYDPTLPSGARLEIASRTATGQRTNRLFMDSEEEILLIDSVYPSINGRGGASVYGRDWATVRSAGYIVMDAPVVRLADVPTSSSGLPSGAIWSDGGTLKIVS